jgi:hypothetical protein
MKPPWPGQDAGFLVGQVDLIAVLRAGFRRLRFLPHRLLPPSATRPAPLPATAPPTSRCGHGTRSCAWRHWLRCLVPSKEIRPRFTSFIVLARLNTWTNKSSSSTRKVLRNWPGCRGRDGFPPTESEPPPNRSWPARSCAWRTRPWHGHKPARLAVPPDGTSPIRVRGNGPPISSDPTGR